MFAGACETYESGKSGNHITRRDCVKKTIIFAANDDEEKFCLAKLLPDTEVDLKVHGDVLQKEVRTIGIGKKLKATSRLWR